jgi:hypothetical protein
MPTRYTRHYTYIYNEIGVLIKILNADGIMNVHLSVPLCG